MRQKRKNSGDGFPRIGGLLISNMIMEEEYPPLFLYREKRIHEKDSGWRIFSGLETDEYLDQEDNFAPYNPSSLLIRDESVGKLLLSEIGAVFEREDINSEWIRVFDYKLDDDFLKQITIGKNWAIEINNLFEEELEEDGTFYFSTGDKSIRIRSWETEASKESLLEGFNDFLNGRNKRKYPFIKQYDFSDSASIIVGHKMQEKSDVCHRTCINGAVHAAFLL